MKKRRGDLLESAGTENGGGELFSPGLVLKAAIIIVAGALLLAMLRDPKELARKHGKERSPAVANE